MSGPYGWKVVIRAYDEQDYYFEGELKETIMLSIPATAGSTDEVFDKAQQAVIDAGFHDGYRLSITKSVDEHGASGFSREIVLIVAGWAFGKLADPLWNQLSGWAKREYEMAKDAPDINVLSLDQRIEYFKQAVRRHRRIEGDLELVNPGSSDESGPVTFQDVDGNQYRVGVEDDGIGVHIEAKSGSF